MIVIDSRNGTVQSTNWSGYAITGASGSVSNAVASWTVPSVKCPSGQTSYSSFWVGIDGFTSRTVEQTGTDSDCRFGVATYYAWYEFFPRASKVIAAIVVHPGDEMMASIVFNGGSSFTDSITDVTTGATFAVTGSVSGALRSSAEFIAEAPVVCRLIFCKLAPLANFGTVGFGQVNTGVTSPVNCVATIGGVTGSIGSFGSAVQQITMIGQSSLHPVKASPSALSSDGTSFTITWFLKGP